MRETVKTAWPTHAREYEGNCPWMYLDTLDNLTIGIGTLMEGDGTNPPTELLDLDWRWITDNRLATDTEIIKEWRYVQTRTDLSPRGGYHFDDITKLRISATTVDTLLWRRTWPIWNRLLDYVPALVEWPADAQLAFLDMGYNHGPNFLNLDRYTEMQLAAEQEDFDRMADYCRGRSTIARRWIMRAQLFDNAEFVDAGGMDKDRLWGNSPNLEEMAMALAEDVAKYLLNTPLLDDPVTGEKRSLKYLVERIRAETNGLSSRTKTILAEVDQTEELITSVLAEVDQTEEGLAEAKKLNADRAKRLSEALAEPVVVPTA